MFGTATTTAAPLIATIVSVYFLTAVSVIVLWLRRTRLAKQKKHLMTHLAIRGHHDDTHAARGKSISEALADLKAYRRTKKSNAWARLLVSAGIDISPRFLAAVWIGVIVCIEAVIIMLGVSTIVHVLGLTVVLFLPYLILKQRANRLKQKFSEDFAAAVDVIVRGVRSGLSVNGCFKVVAEEGPDAVRTQFKKLFNDLDLGVPLIKAMERLSDRIPLPEVKFFATVISVQSQTGGNLSTALENLSNILRERKQLKGKIKALSSEAKTSSWIIGSLPVVVLGIVQLVSPQYSSVLFVSVTGQLILAGAIAWMAIGVFVMSRMIDLEV